MTGYVGIGVNSTIPWQLQPGCRDFLNLLALKMMRSLGKPSDVREIWDPSLAIFNIWKVQGKKLPTGVNSEPGISGQKNTRIQQIRMTLMVSIWLALCFKFQPILPSIRMLLWKFFYPTVTLPETNIVPENGWLEDDSFPFGIRIAAYFQGRKWLVSGKVFGKSRKFPTIFPKLPERREEKSGICGIETALFWSHLMSKKSPSHSWLESRGNQLHILQEIYIRHGTFYHFDGIYHQKLRDCFFWFLF